MERHGIDEQAAFDMLREHARGTIESWSTWRMQWWQGTRCFLPVPTRLANRRLTLEREQADSRSTEDHGRPG